MTELGKRAKREGIEHPKVARHPHPDPERATPKAKPKRPHPKPFGYSYISVSPWLWPPMRARTQKRRYRWYAKESARDQALAHELKMAEAGEKRYGEPWYMQDFRKEKR